MIPDPNGAWGRKRKNGQRTGGDPPQPETGALPRAGMGRGVSKPEYPRPDLYIRLFPQRYPLVPASRSLCVVMWAAGMTRLLFATTCKWALRRLLRLSVFDYVVLAGGLINLIVVSLIITHWIMR